MRPGERERVLDAARRLHGKVRELRPLHGIDAGQVQHADTLAFRAEQGCAGAAVNAGVVEKMLAAVQPDRTQIGEHGADGSGSDGALG